MKTTIKKHLCRVCSIYAKDNPKVPAELFSFKNEKADLKGFEFISPVKKSDYTIALKAGKVLWLGSDKGLVRVDPEPADYFDKVLYFSADRDLKDNKVLAIMGDEINVWVLTETGVSDIHLISLTGEEKSDLLLKETQMYVDRHGMITQKALAVPGDVTSAVEWGHSDNDGCFTANFAVGEIYKYATLCRELGEDHEKTKEALNTSVRAIEAILLLMHVCKRGNGFVARSYLLKGEPLPDDGLFFEIHGDKAVCAETTESISRGCNGLEIDASCPIPERLRHLFTDEGGDEEGLIYKADTSSDEITGHVITLVIAHRFLAKADPELDELIVFSLDRLVRFIIDGGLQLIDYSGESTTWAKWNEEYFNTPFGYVDACLNSAQMLMYLKAAMYVTGEEGIFKETYDMLINEKGYADLTMKHFDRMYQSSLVDGIDYFEDIMYGDHMLAVEAFWGLCMLEKDPVLLQKYRTGFKSWKSSIKREYNPGYYFPFLISCPDETIDMERMREWFSRFNVSRLASGVSLIGRHDVPVRTLRKGYKQTSYLLPNDEQFISKYDRDPFEYKNVDSGGTQCVESCYVYTFAYWIGRYYGFLGSEED